MRVIVEFRPDPKLLGNNRAEFEAFQAIEKAARDAIASLKVVEVVGRAEVVRVMDAHMELNDVRW